MIFKSEFVLIDTIFYFLPRNCLFTNSDWFAFREDRCSEHLSVSRDDGDYDSTDDDVRGGGGSSDEDEVVIENMEIFDPAESMHPQNLVKGGDLTSSSAKEEDCAFGFEVQVTTGDDLFDDQQLPDWVGWHQSSDILLDGNGSNPDPLLPEHGCDDPDDRDHDGASLNSRKVEVVPSIGGKI